MDGNTSHPFSKPRVSAAVHWAFTYNNYTPDGLRRLEDQLRLHGSDYRAQSEVGGESGTPHIQGYIKLKKKGRPMELFKMPEIHWEKGRNVPALMAYCCKSETADGKVVLQPEQKPPTSDWERRLLRILIAPPTRGVHWYWSRVPDVQWDVAEYIQRTMPDVLTNTGGVVSPGGGSTLLIITNKNTLSIDENQLEQQVATYAGHVVVFAGCAPKGVHGRWNVVDVDTEDCVESMVRSWAQHPLGCHG